jgi:hypothetical protein
MLLLRVYVNNIFIILWDFEEATDTSADGECKLSIVSLSRSKNKKEKKTVMYPMWP